MIGHKKLKLRIALSQIENSNYGYLSASIRHVRYYKIASEMKKQFHLLLDDYV